MIVKGSKQYKTKVVLHRPLQRAFFVFIGTLMICGLCALCLWLGYKEAERHQQIALNEWDSLKILTKEQANQIEQLTVGISNTRIGSDVDKQAIDGLRQDIITLNKKISELEESNNFYRKLMEPKELTKGLAVGSFTLTPAPQSNESHYQLVIQQFAKEPRTIAGRMNVTLVGTENNQAKSYALHELSKNIATVDIPFNFRFYQSFEGDFTLPNGFQLQRVDVLVEKMGTSTPIVRSFDMKDNLN